MMNMRHDNRFSHFLGRYSQGEWRAPIFHDLILAEVQGFSECRAPVLLDIGCGRGFDDDAKLQASLSEIASQYVGVEPDKDIELEPVFTEVHRCRFEEAPIPANSIDLAFAVMVLEHLASPQTFWDKVHEVLRADGIFWGFTVDARHWFVNASLIAKRLHIKDGYLNMLHGKRGQERYENYPVYYKSNTPEQIERLTQAFGGLTILNFHRLGQLDYYFPARMRWVGRLLDQVNVASGGLLGNVMAVRVVK